MGYNDDLNAYLAQNPGDAYHSSYNAEQVQQIGMPPQDGDPMVAGVDPGVQAPAAPYGGLSGDPYQTAVVTSAQLAALAPPKRPMRRRAPQPPTPFAGLSSYLGV